jgi:hypothetical protein
MARRRINLTVSVVVGLEHDEDVLEHGKDDEGVEDDREDADEVVRVPDAARERAGLHVELRRPDVAVHHADALERQLQRLRPAAPGSVILGPAGDLLGVAIERVTAPEPFHRRGRALGCGRHLVEIDAARRVCSKYSICGTSTLQIPAPCKRNLVSNHNSIYTASSSR